MKIKINEKDNVFIDTTSGHKYASCDIKKGEYIIKYSYPIGIATENIKKGEHVHIHNVKSYITSNDKYSYIKEPDSISYSNSSQTISAYVRKNGEIGIRNDIWIVPTVGCINSVAKQLSDLTQSIALTHPYGCSQLGDDLLYTQKILSNLITHPNAGGVLVLGLGCENNNITELKKQLGSYDDERIRFLNCQTEKDELSEGVKIITELKIIASKDKRVPVPISKLVVGLKCGGSDGLSGITANPLLGRFTNKHISYGGSCVMTEVPEMFGAEQILMNRCKDEQTYTKLVEMINGFKLYYISHNQQINENPSPGNKEGGITTLEEKSLGCILKGGIAPVNDVIMYGDKVKTNGLTLLSGPGNDIVSSTNLASSHCQILLFTTGRGTPYGCIIPTIKVSTNSTLSSFKKEWIDFDSSPILLGENLDDEFYEFVLKIANGEKTKNELSSYREIAIFKDGVTL